MNIVKIGGGEAVRLDGIVADIAELGQPCIIVHGANALRDELAARLGIEKRVLTSVSGYTSVYSDAPLIDAIMMSYAGLRNKRLVELCQQHGVNALGLSGIDGRAIEGRRNKGVRVRCGGKTMLERDLSGKPRRVNRELFDWLLANAYVPVLSIPILDEQASAINSENDDIVVLLHEVLGAVKIFQLIEAPGLLADPDDPGSLVTRMSAAELQSWEQRVQGRMRRKLLALSRLFQTRPTQVHICDGRADRPLRAALEGGGTLIR